MKKLLQVAVYLSLIWRQRVCNSPSDTSSSSWHLPATHTATHQTSHDYVSFPWRTVDSKPPYNQFPLHSGDRTHDHSSSSLQKEKRQAENNSQFVWKSNNKTPKFVTSILEKQKAGPVLREYPPDVVYRNSRSRELAVPQQNGLKRIVYYTTLPDVPRYSPVSNRRQHDYHSLPLTVPLNQRSYDPNKAGKDFVTRVQSGIIGIVPRGENKKDVNSTPSFTIIDANPTPYPLGMDRIMVDYQNLISGVDNNRHISPFSYSSIADPYQHLYPQTMKLHHPNMIPYHGGVDKSQYHQPQFQFQHQTIPYHYTQVEKIGSTPFHPNQQFSTAPINPPPYPTRHNRFPSDRYPPTSTLNFLDAPAGRPSHLESHQPYQNPHQNPQPHGLGHEPPSTSTPMLLSDAPGFNINDMNFPSLDHMHMNLDNQRPFRNKFSNFNEFFSGSPVGNKYLDLSGGAGITNQFQYKPQYSPASDWITSQPIDMSSIEGDDFNSLVEAANAAATGGQDLHIKGSSSISGDSAQNNGTDKEVSNTVLTPYTSSFGNSTFEEVENNQ